MFDGVMGLQKIVVVVLLLTSLLIGGCQNKEEHLKVAVVPGLQADIMKEVKKSAARDGLDIEIIMCSDYMEPNDLLNKNEVDANSYQPEQFLDWQLMDRGYDFAILAKTVLLPLRMYSHKIGALAELPKGASVVIPADAINASRAIKLLAQSGLIVLRDSQASEVSLTEIVQNPLELKIEKVDALSMGDFCEQADLLVMGTSIAEENGFVSPHDIMYEEGTDSPYVDVIAVRSADVNKKAMQKLVKAYQSVQVKEFIEKEFGGKVVATW